MKQSDVDETGRDQGQSKGGNRAVYAIHRCKVQATTEQELRRLTSKSNEVFVIYDGKIVRPETIKHLKNHAIVHVVDKLSGGGKKKSRRKSNQTHSDQSGSRSSETDMFFELMQRNCEAGEMWNEDLFQTLL